MLFLILRFTVTGLVFFGTILDQTH